MITQSNINELQTITNNIESFTIFTNGNKEQISKNSHLFNQILTNVDQLLSQSRIMPALGVSLHADTVNSLKSNSWIEINFNQLQIVNDFPFNSLLFKLEPTYGTNLIRKYNNKYDGRCIYIDFMQEIDLNYIINNSYQKGL